MTTNDLTARDAITALKELLPALSADILAPGDFHERLAPAISQYSALLFKATNITTDEPATRENVITTYGKAIGTLWAGMCVDQPMRTQRFCRGLYKAIADRLAQNPGGLVHVVYAGTGPFAALALPVMMQFEPGQLQFTLLEINNQSYAILKRLLNALGLDSYVRRIELCDATQWKAPDEDIDIVISETMNKALIKEPQVCIMLNMAKQLPPAVTYIPTEIKVNVAWFKNYQTEPTPLIQLCNFNRESYLKIVERCASEPDWIFEPVIFNYTPIDGGRLVYTTDITVYRDEKLGYNDCSLNLIEKIRSPVPTQPALLQFKYGFNPSPGFACTVLQDDIAFASNTY